MARKITVQATAYGPPWDAMEGTGVTSTGVDLRKGQQKLVVAVDPSVIPYGTKLRIPDNPFGNPDLIFTAADTGGAIKGNRLDFYVASGRKDQNRWGRRNTTVEVVGRGSPKDVAVLGGQQQPRAAVAPAAVRPAAGATTTTTGPNTDARRQIIASWLLSSNNDPLSLASQLAAVPKVTTTTTRRVPQRAVSPRSPARASSGNVVVAQGAERAGIGLQKPVLSFLHELAGVSGRTVDVTTGTNHNQFVAGRPGVQSDHWTGNAADLGMGGDARQSSAVAQRGDLVAAHAIQIAGGVPFAKALGMARQGGVWNFQTPRGRVQILWKTMVGGDHYNHVHIGVNPGA